MRFALALILAWLGWLACPVATAATTPAIDELLRSARLWQSLDRPVQERYVLQKILAVDAGQPQALLLLVELELRTGNPAEAQRLAARLRQAGDGAALAELDDLMRLYGPDRARLNQLRLLRRGGNQEQALALARELFPDGRPPGELAAEFALLLAAAPGGWERSRAWLEERIARGGGPRERLVLYELLAQRASTRPEAVRGLDELAAEGQLPAARIEAARRTALAAAPAAPAGASVARASAPAARVPPSAAHARRPGQAPPPPAAAAPTAPPPAAEADRYWPLLREAEALRDAGRTAEAAALVKTALRLQPGEAEGGLLMADLERRLGRTDAAVARYRALQDVPAARGRAARRLIGLLQDEHRFDEVLAEVSSWPEPLRTEAATAIDTGALRTEADARIARQQPGAALRLLENTLVLLPREPWLRYDLARLYARLGQPALAQAVVDEGLVDPDAEMRYAMALYYASVERDADALVLLDAVAEAERSDGQRALAARLRAAREREGERVPARRQPTDEAALFPVYRDADPGLSTLHGAELPIVITRPWGDDGNVWLHIDPVHLDARSLPAAFGEASLFGKVYALGQGAPLAGDLPQRADGLSVGVGWDGENRRWDLGIIGAGFRVPNVVGGWRESFDWQGIDAALEVSRRILTGSLLSYSGTSDPISGQVWGGVTLNSASLWLGRYSDTGWSASASLRAGVLEGRNVADNGVVQVRLVADHDLLKTPALRINAGVRVALWRYRENQGFFTFGQGGYYSPQRYTSVGMPIELQAPQGPWTMRLRALVAHSWTYEADTPYYPTDAALQASAGDPHHAGGGSGGGFSFSVRADAERRLDSQWSVGASFIADRSAYYAPVQMLFYLRRSLGARPAETGLPRPVQPYSQF